MVLLLTMITITEMHVNIIQMSPSEEEEELRKEERHEL